MNKQSWRHKKQKAKRVTGMDRKIRKKMAAEAIEPEKEI